MANELQPLSQLLKKAIDILFRSSKQCLGATQPYVACWGESPIPKISTACLSAHFAKCSIYNPAFYAQTEYKNFRTAIKRAEIFVDYVY